MLQRFVLSVTTFGAVTLLLSIALIALPLIRFRAERTFGELWALLRLVPPEPSGRLKRRGIVSKPPY